MVRYSLLFRNLLLAVAALAALSAGVASAAQDGFDARLREEVTFLASDACEGRGVGTRGINLAADYIASAFKQAGLLPAGKDGSYFQAFTMPGGTLEAPPHLVLHGPQGQAIELVAGRHFEALGLSQSGKVTDAPILFVGYGISAGKDVVYDDYQDVDVSGNVVIIVRDTPRAGNKAVPFDGSRRQKDASLTEKLQNAAKHGAAAVLLVNDRGTAGDGDELMNFFMTAAGGSQTKLPGLHVQRAVVESMLDNCIGSSLRELEEDIDRDLKPRSMSLAGWTASLELRVRRTIDVKNVVGVLEGSGPLANETVVVGAHYDHLGYGGSGSLFKLRKPAIHPGADDNGSGSAALMELARHFAQVPRRQGRRLVFIAFSGEESGLLGSVYYCKNPLFPLANTSAMVNLDMVGRLSPDKEDKTKDKLIVYGTGTAGTFTDLVEALNKRFDFKLHKVAGGFGPSDHASFYAKQVPVLFLFTGDHADYHRPSDTADKINFAGMHKVIDFTGEIVARLAAGDRPTYIKVAGSTGTPGGVPRIGIRPSYGDDEVGVLLDGVVDGGPADKAGLKEGDRIVEIDGKRVMNLEGYMVLIREHKKGQPVELGVQRKDMKITVKVMPE